jgi:hypothetical protein
MILKIRNENYNLPNFNEVNCRKYFDMLNSISLVAGSIIYDNKFSPEENMIKMCSETIGTKYETELDWIDCVNGVFDKCMNETFDEHFNNIFQSMIHGNIDYGMTAFKGEFYTIERNSHKFIVKKDNKIVLKTVI